MNKPTFKEYREKRYQEEDLAFQLALEQSDLQCYFVSRFDENEIEYGPCKMVETTKRDGYRVYCGDIKTTINKIVLKKKENNLLPQKAQIFQRILFGLSFLKP